MTIVSNEGIITTFGNSGTLGNLDDTVDKMHSGLIKTLWNTATGSRVVSSGTLTQSNGVFTLAHPTVFRSQGTKITLSTGALDNQATLTINNGSYDRYDLLYIDKDANSDLGQLSIAVGTFNGSNPKVADLAREDVPIAIIKVPSGTGSLTGVTFNIQLLMSEYNKDVLDDDEVTYAKIQNVVNDERVLGRVSGANGVIEELTQAQVLTFLGGVEAGADVTDATNVNAAGAIMHTDIPDSDTGFVKRTGVSPETYDIDTNTYLTAEADTLDSVTGRGATTTNNISVGTITSTVNQNLGYEVHNNGTGPIMTGAKTVVYVDDITALTPANQVTLPPPAAGNILHIVNIGGVPITIIGNPVINLGLTTHAKIAVANQITLAPHEYVTLQAHNDTVTPLVTGHMIISD